MTKPMVLIGNASIALSEIGRWCNEAQNELDVLRRENAALKETQERMLLELQSYRAADEPSGEVVSEFGTVECPRCEMKFFPPIELITAVRTTGNSA